MSVQTQSPGRRPAGFTLVEVVVALAVLSLILLATVSALRTFANTQESIDRVVTRLDEVRTVSSFLRDSLDSAIVGDVSTGGLTLGGSETPPAYFRGDRNSLEWKSAVLFGEGYGGVYLMRVALEGNDLVLRWREPSGINRRKNWASAQSKVLLADVEQFQLAFRRDYVRGWENNWRRSDPPVSVRLNIRSRERNWPELIMQVRR
jgi:general secretion pathway protein J